MCLKIVLDHESPDEHPGKERQDGRPACAHARDEGHALIVEEEAEEGRHDDAADCREERREGARPDRVVQGEVRRGEAPVAARPDGEVSAEVRRRGNDRADDVQPGRLKRKTTSAAPSTSRAARSARRTKKMGSSMPIFLVETVCHKRRNCSFVDV